MKCNYYADCKASAVVKVGKNSFCKYHAEEVIAHALAVREKIEILKRELLWMRNGLPMRLPTNLQFDVVANKCGKVE